MVSRSEKRIETRDEAVCRLAVEAKKRGIQIFTYPHTGEYFATSHRNPGTLHRVTLISCDCVGFIGHGRCSHHSALLDHVGELPTIDTDPTPDPAKVEALATIESYPIPTVEKVPAVLAARAEIERLARNPKSTADFWNLQNARARFDQLVTESAALVAA